MVRSVKSLSQLTITLARSADYKYSTHWPRTLWMGHTLNHFSSSTMTALITGFHFAKTITGHLTVFGSPSTTITPSSLLTICGKTRPTPSRCGSLGAIALFSQPNSSIILDLILYNGIVKSFQGVLHSLALTS